MKISTRRDIDVSPNAVFSALTDFDAFAERGRAAGATIERLDDGTQGAAQARWRVRFEFRGRDRQAEGRVVTYDPDTQLALKAETDGTSAIINVEIMQVAPSCARMFVAIDLRPTTMKGRLLVQSLKLAKAALTKRLDKRLATFARQLEAHRDGTS